MAVHLHVDFGARQAFAHVGRAVEREDDEAIAVELSFRRARTVVAKIAEVVFSEARTGGREIRAFGDDVKIRSASCRRSDA